MLPSAGWRAITYNKPSALHSLETNVAFHEKTNATVPKYSTLVVHSEVSGEMTLHVPWASERTGAALSSVAALPHSVSAPRLVPASRVRTETLTLTVVSQVCRTIQPMYNMPPLLNARGETSPPARLRTVSC